MSLRFTESRDGTPRANVRVTLRLCAEELDMIRDLARKSNESWRVWIQRQAEEGLYSAMVNGQSDGEYEQRYGKGDA